MSRRTLKTDDEAGFLMAVADDWVENERLFDCHITMELRRTNRRGHFEIVCIATRDAVEADDLGMQVTRTPYPSVSATRLHAGLYRAMIALGAVLARSWLEKRESE